MVWGTQVQDVSCGTLEKPRTQTSEFCPGAGQERGGSPPRLGQVERGEAGRAGEGAAAMGHGLKS